MGTKIEKQPCTFTDRVVRFDVQGRSYIASDCNDVRRLHIDFKFCPICGANRQWKDGESFLVHDRSYSGVIH